MNKYNNALTNKKVLIMGLGRNNGGLGSTIFAIESGAKEIYISDMKDEEFNKPSIDKIYEYVNKNNIDIKIHYVLGGHTEDEFKWAEVVIKNPAVQYSNPFIKLAQDNGATIETEVTLFLSQRNKNSQVIGITGTKGKSTTTKLIYHILKSSQHIHKKEIFTAGNMGISMLDSLDINFEGIYVLELSSFVTEAIYKNNLSIDYYIITSLFADHLNYYDNLEQYYHAKIDLIHNLNKSHVYINDSNPDLHTMCKSLEVNKINCLNYEHLEFPEFFSDVLKIDSTLASRFIHEVYGIDYTVINNAFRTYKEVEGRFERLGNVFDVAFINDTCASIPEAALAGLNTLKNKGSKIFLITGGSDKGLKFDQFFDFINKECQKVYLIKGGNTFNIFKNHINSELLSIKDNLSDATISAFNDAQKQSDSVVILSRGCTSFGIALNEFEMGKEFSTIFNTLKNQNK